FAGLKDDQIAFNAAVLQIEYISGASVWLNTNCASWSRSIKNNDVREVFERRFDYRFDAVFFISQTAADHAIGIRLKIGINIIQRKPAGIFRLLKGISIIQIQKLTRRERIQQFPSLPGGDLQRSFFRQFKIWMNSESERKFSGPAVFHMSFHFQPRFA